MRPRSGAMPATMMSAGPSASSDRRLSWSVQRRPGTTRPRADRRGRSTYHQLTAAPVRPRPKPTASRRAEVRVAGSCPPPLRPPRRSVDEFGDEAVHPPEVPEIQPVAHRAEGDEGSPLGRPSKAATGAEDEWSDDSEPDHAVGDLANFEMGQRVALGDGGAAHPIRVGHEDGQGHRPPGADRSECPGGAARHRFDVAVDADHCERHADGDQVHVGGQPQVGDPRELRFAPPQVAEVGESPEEVRSHDHGHQAPHLGPPHAATGCDAPDRPCVAGDQGIEEHLDRQGPSLDDAVEQRRRPEDIEQGQMRQRVGDAVHPDDAGRPEEAEGEPVGGHHPQSPSPPERPDRDRPDVAGVGARERAVDQTSRQHEEDRHAHVHRRGGRGEPAAPLGTGEGGRVVDDDEGRCRDSYGLERWVGERWPGLGAPGRSHAHHGGGVCHTTMLRPRDRYRRGWGRPRPLR